MILYGMRRPCLVVDRIVQVAACRVFGKPDDTDPEVLFWWMMLHMPACMLYDLSLLLLEEGRKTGKRNR